MTAKTNCSLGMIISLAVVSYRASAFSLRSFVGDPYSGSLRCKSRVSNSHLSNKVTALNIWNTREAEEKVETEVPNEKKTLIGNFFDNSKSVTNGSTTNNNRDLTTPSLPSIPKLGDWTNFLRTETDDIWEEELSATAFKDNSNNAIGTQDGSSKKIAAVAVSILLLGSLALFGDSGTSNTLLEPISYVQQFFNNPTESLERVVTQVESMGSVGQAYFAGIYVIAEILAIPAIPLTASAGYLFGVKEGTLIVLFSASIAAAVSFIIGRTLLRDYVEGVLEENPKFKQLDKAIGQEGFKLMLLLRLSPIFPFALSNYLYGATSVRFWPYFFGTMLGFTPGTIAYVYTGEIGKALTLESASAEPWYVYAGALTLLTGFIKLAADVATGIIDGLEDEEI